VKLTKRLIEEAENEAQQELLEIIKECREPEAIIKEAKSAVHFMEREMDLRRVPYGYEFAPKKSSKGRSLGAIGYFIGIPTAVLSIKRKIYLKFIEDFQKEIEERRTIYLLPRGVSPYNWNITELREMCRSEGLPDSGDKNILIQRLRKVKKQ